MLGAYGGGRPVSRWDAQGLAGPPPCPPTGECSRKCLQNGPCVHFPGTTLDSIILIGSASGPLGNSCVWVFFGVSVYLQSVVTHHWLFQGLCSSTVDIISLENEV